MTDRKVDFRAALDSGLRNLGVPLSEDVLYGVHVALAVAGEMLQDLSERPESEDPGKDYVDGLGDAGDIVRGLTPDLPLGSW